MHHSFNVVLAQRLGLVQAILLENIYFWVSKNEFNEKNVFEGRGWTYNSVKAFNEQFPYLTEKQVRTALEKMEQDGIILSANYNRSKYDRTKWYSITDEWREQLVELGYRFAHSGKSICPNGNFHLPIRANGNAQEGKPIPYPNTYPNTYSNTDDTSQVQKWTSETRTSSTKKKVEVSEEATKLAELLRSEILRQFPNNATAKKELCAKRWAVDIDRMIRLDHRTPENVRDAILWAMNDEFWRRNIWSGAKLRKQYDRLDADARAGFLKHGTITVGGNNGKSTYNNPF